MEKRTINKLVLNQLINPSNKIIIIKTDLIDTYFYGVPWYLILQHTQHLGSTV